ncbi:MAG TPA: phage portal protein [Burkholderiales bacterium]|nr:phage portal protein [Burkholderiales bacterium]
MGWLSRLETRATAVDPLHPRDPALAAWFGSNNTVLGNRITPDTALELIAVFACVRLIAETLAMLPLPVYRRRADDGREIDRSHRLYSILNARPNRWQTAMQFREMMIGHCLLRGNAYAQIVGTGGRGVDQLIPLHPDRVWPFWRSQQQDVAYAYFPAEGGKRVFLRGELFHLAGLGFDGLRGVSPIALHREALGFAAALQEHGGRTFVNGTRLSGVIEHPARLGDALPELRKQWDEIYSGLANTGKVAILEEGMKWHQIGMTLEDAQYVALSEKTTEDIARIYRVPPDMIGSTTKTTSWGTGVEQRQIGFVVHTLTPWSTRYEQCVERDLFNEGEEATHYVEHNVTALLRGDQKSRYEAYRSGIAAGWLLPNEARAKENLNPLPGLSLARMPLNMTVIDEMGEIMPPVGKADMAPDPEPPAGDDPMMDPPARTGTEG